MDEMAVPGPGAMNGAISGAPGLGNEREMGGAGVMEAAGPLSPPDSGAGLDGDGELDESVTDSRRNWSPEVLLELAKIYKRVVLENPEMSRLGLMQLVYDEFKKDVDCSSRSRKAVDDKLYSMKQMYHFIMKMNGNFKLGYRKSVPTWFELTKQERRAVRFVLVLCCHGVCHALLMDSRCACRLYVDRRSLHRVRTPNISLDVFRVLDSVLNPNPSPSNDSEDVAAPASESPASVMATSSTPAAASTGGIPDVVDAKRNWSDDVTLELAKAWNAVHQQHPELRGAMLSHQVYNAFMTSVGFSNRSRKAVDDKMHSMREMYRFVRTYEAQREAGENKPAWFDLTKKERREMRARHKVRVPNLSQEVYDEIEQVMSRSSFEPDDDESPDPSAAEIDMNPQLSMPSGGDQAAEVNAEPQLPSAPATPALAQAARQSTDYTAVPQVTTAPGTTQANGSAPALSANGVWLNENPSNAHLPPNAAALAANVAEGAAEPAAKRRRTHPELAAASGSGPLDANTARLLCEQLRMMHEQDRQERRRQHAEQMAVLREIADLLRQKS